MLLLPIRPAILDVVAVCRYFSSQEILSLKGNVRVWCSAWPLLSIPAGAPLSKPTQPKPHTLCASVVLLNWQ